MVLRCLLSLIALLGLSYSTQVFGQEQAKPTWTRLEVYPPTVLLNDSREAVQLVVTAYDGQNQPTDVTDRCTIEPADSSLVSLDRTLVRSLKDGPEGRGTELVIKLGDLSTKVPVELKPAATPKPIGFENEVLVALSKQSCNSGACHGSPSGKGGFRLSLRAFDPQLDTLTLTQEEFGRRINLLEPEKSLLLEKPLMIVAHGGGLQLRKSNVAYQVIRDWIAAGAKLDVPQTPRITRVEIYPNQRRILQAPNHRQQLAVVAHFADGTRRDVTQLASYSSSNMNVATVSEGGLVTASQRGEAAILVRVLEHIETLPLMFVEDIPTFQWKDQPVQNHIDELVDAKLRQLKYAPADLCSDAEFLRRVTLDVTGLLPKLETTQQFLASTDPQKRSKYIDQLLEQPEYAKFWALKWGDWLRLTGKRIGDEAIYKYHRWIEESIAENKPYNQFVSELVASSGSTLSNPPANFYRAAGDMHECVETFSQLFLGARMQCAKCHNHPFERWTQDNYYGLGAFSIAYKERKRPVLERHSFGSTTVAKSSSRARVRP